MTDPEQSPPPDTATPRPETAPVRKPGIVLSVIAIALGLLSLGITSCSLIFVPMVAGIALPCLAIGMGIGWVAWKLWRRNHGR